MKPKNQNSNNFKPGGSKNKSGVKKKIWNNNIRIPMVGTEKVKPETVIGLCAQVMQLGEQEMKNQEEKEEEANEDNKIQEKPKKNKPPKQKGRRRPDVMNYKLMKIQRQRANEKEAAEKARLAMDTERVTATTGPREITKKMIKAAKEKEAHKQGVLHLWGRVGSGAFKKRYKRAGNGGGKR